MTMTKIEYTPEDYKVIKTEEMDDELLFKFVQFNSGIYGVISENPKQQMETVILLSPEKDYHDEFYNASISGGLGCMSFLIFAHNAKKHMENAPIEMVVKLGDTEEYREIITREDSKTLYEKVNCCIEIFEIKHENSFIYKYGDLIQTVLLCIIALSMALCIVNTCHLWGVI